ncbi:uncharacterized protein Dvir_GJ12860 [Drosophila virilis]|uniref:Fibrinogen C-terminal domain-containing protein n=1 Tax=Drosophila virilis TaxID=7244 RepID=B4LQU6_DROVI|nr:uncharacterized protein Dvir_GJ12860 [Drosophila virilis]
MFQYGSTSYEIPEDESKSAAEVVVGSAAHSDIFRLKEELNELYGMVDEYIQSNYDNNSSELKHLTATDIIRKLIDTNATHTLNSLRSSCPPYRNAHGIHTANVTGLPPFQVLCNTNLAGPGWTVIASRTVGDLNFFRNWRQYKQGFGNLTNEFFIGLDKLHAITASQPHELYIYFEDFSGNRRYARYDEFLIGTESEKYAIKKLGSYSGDAGDSLTRHAKKKFSTHDNDNDANSENCAIERMGAWWYADCTDSNLFGLYLGGKYHSKLFAKGMFWITWLGTEYSYKVLQIMVRPKCPCSYSG